MNLSQKPKERAKGSPFRVLRRVGFPENSGKYESKREKIERASGSSMLKLPSVLNASEIQRVTGLLESVVAAAIETWNQDTRMALVSLFQTILLPYLRLTAPEDYPLKSASEKTVNGRDTYNEEEELGSDEDGLKIDDLRGCFEDITAIEQKKNVLDLNSELEKIYAAIKDLAEKKGISDESVAWELLTKHKWRIDRAVKGVEARSAGQDIVGIFDLNRTEDTKHVKPAWGHRLESRMESLVLGLFSGSDDPSRERDVALTARFASMLAYSPSDHYHRAKRGRLRKLELEELNRTLVKIGEEIGGCDPASVSTVIASQQQALTESLDLLCNYWQFESYREVLTPGIEKICSFALRKDLVQAMMDVIPDRFGHVLYHWSWENQVVQSFDPDLFSGVETRSKLFVNMCNFISGVSDFRRDLLLPALSACCGLCVVKVSNQCAELCFDEAKASVDTFISLAEHSDGHIRALALRMIGYFSSGTNDVAVDYTLLRGAARAVCTALSDGRTNTAPARKDCWWTLYNWSAGSELQHSFLFGNEDEEKEESGKVDSGIPPDRRLDFCLLALRCFAKERDFLVTKEIAIFLEKALAENDFPDNLILSSIDFVIGSRFNTDTMLMEKTTANMKSTGNDFRQVRDIEICWMLWLLNAILKRCVSFAEESDTNLGALKQNENTLEKAFEMFSKYRDSYISGDLLLHTTWSRVMGYLKIPTRFEEIAILFGNESSSLWRTV